MNEIHPTAIIGKDVVLGKGNKILPYTIIDGPTIIGDNNIIGPHAIIGCPPTDTKKVSLDFKNPHLRIGNNNIIREFCVIEQPCYEELTIIGNEVFLMQGVHISHDVHLNDKVVITNTSVLAGIVKMLEGSYLGMACTVNQYTVIGQYSIVATNSACMKNVKPFSRYIPNKPISVNKYAIEKYGFSEYEREIFDYVLHNKEVKSEKLMSIIVDFEKFVNLYGHETYK